MKSKLIGPGLVTLCIIFLTLGAIYYGRGYRLDFKRKELKGTGILVANSTPAGASLFLNGRLTSATNDTLNLEPGTYDVRLVKEGYIPWEKKITIKKEVVSETNAVLFPSNPSLSPLTFAGVKNPTLSPDGTKIAYIIPYDSQTQTLPAGRSSLESPTIFGVFLLDLNSHPLPFFRKPSQLFSYRVSAKEQMSLYWSPDSTQVLFLLEKAAFLLEAGKKNETPPNLIGTYDSVLENWQKQKEELEQRKLLSLPYALTEFFKSSTKILSFSQDQTKILYQASASATIPQIIKPPLSATNSTEETREIEPDKIYVYDQKEDRNYEIMKQEDKETRKQSSHKDTSEVEVAKSKVPAPRWPSALGESTPLMVKRSNLQWLPTSRHLILTEEDKISILEYDGTNKATVYANDFEENFVAPWPDASKLVILTTLNPSTSTLPNLYSLSLR